MISQFVLTCKVILALHATDDTESFQTIYDNHLEKALMPGRVIVIPDTDERYIVGAPNPVDGKSLIKKDGRYERNVTHVYAEMKNGKKTLHFYETKVRVQNMEAYTGHHHALLMNLLVPYGNFSTLACFYTLYSYFKSGQSPEDFCDGFNHVDLTVTQLKEMIAWAKELFPLLEIDVTPADNTAESVRKAWMKGLSVIFENQSFYHARCIQVRGMGLFQRKPPVCSPYLTGIPFLVASSS